MPVQRPGFRNSFDMPLGLLEKRTHPLQRGSTWLTVAMLVATAISIALGFYVSSLG